MSGQQKALFTLSTKMRELIVDCFAGGGGASVGIEMALGRQVDIAINHDPLAIKMHEMNHPNTYHYTEDIMKVSIRNQIKQNDIVKLMWASPDCTQHSRAKGGKPVEKGLRILPYGVRRLCIQILDITGNLPEVIIMENVAEIQDWGPLDKNNRPIKERKGEDYKKFINSMKSLGYDFDSRELVAADYGVPTIRKRWFAIFRCDNKQIVWPPKTHSKGGVDGMQEWVPASANIDFTDLGKSIFDRKKPLAEKTQIRISNGIKKFIINNPKPFIVPEKDAMAFLIQYHSESRKGDVRGQNLDEPLQTIDTSNRYGLVTAFITKFYKTGTGQGCDEPLHTITTSPGHFGLVSAFLIKYYGNEIDGQSVDLPLGTIVTKDRFGLVNVVFDIAGEKYIIKDIFLRMLKPEESKLSQGFPKDYIIDHYRDWSPVPVQEQTKRIGNSVCPGVAKELVESNVPYLKTGERKPNMRIKDDETQLRFA